MGVHITQGSKGSGMSYTLDGRIDELEQLVEDSAALIERQGAKYDSLHAMWRQLVATCNEDARQLTEATRRADAWRDRAAEAVRQRDDAKAEASRLRADLAAITERSEAKPGRPTTIELGAAVAMGVHIAITVAIAVLVGIFMWNAFRMILMVAGGHV